MASDHCNCVMHELGPEPCNASGPSFTQTLFSRYSVYATNVMTALICVTVAII